MGSRDQRTICVSNRFVGRDAIAATTEITAGETRLTDRIRLAAKFGFVQTTFCGIYVVIASNIEINMIESVIIAGWLFFIAFVVSRIVDEDLEPAMLKGVKVVRRVLESASARADIESTAD